MHKPHSIPIALNFLKHRARYINEKHYIQFYLNSVIIRPILNRTQQTGNINDLLALFKSILRKYRDKHLHKLHLYIYGCHELDKVTLGKIGLEIAKHFKNLQEFTLQFFMCDNLTDEMIEGLLFPISKTIKNLRKLNISLNSCTILNENSIKLVRSLLLKNVCCTEKLTLNFTPMRFKLPRELAPFDSSLDTIKLTKENMTAHPVCNIPLQEIYLLSKNISQYLGPNLQQLSLTLPQPLDLDTIQTWKDRKMILQSLKHIRRLHLSLANFLTETANYEKELIIVSEHIGQNLLDLQYLSLDFYFLKVPALTDESIMKIASNIFPHLNKLKGFKLICQDNAIITNEGIISFMQEMCQHTILLEDLTLSFQTVSNLTSEIMDTIICYFDESLHSIKNLTLDFLQTDIDCIGIKYLSSEACASMESLNLYTSHPLLAISPDLTNLKVLTLYIDNCVNMADQIFESLVQSILSIPFKQLEELSLSFLKARLLTDNALQVLDSEKWPHLNKLKAFTLEFSQSKQIGEIALGLTTKFIKENLINLQSLTLIFQEGGLIGKLGIKFLMTNLVKHLKYLQYLCLDFYDSVLSRYDHVEELLEEIIDKISKNIRSLKSLKLRFGCCEIGDPAQSIARKLKQLSFIPIVSIK